MFKRHSLQVKMVKDDKNETSEIDEIEVFAEKVACLASYGRDTVILISKACLAYVVIDTVRQVTIERAKK